MAQRTNKTRLRVFKEHYVQSITVTTVSGDKALAQNPPLQMSWEEAQEMLALLKASQRRIAAKISFLRKFNPELPEHSCVECGVVFRAVSGAKTCSDRCRKRAQRTRAST